MNHDNVIAWNLATRNPGGCGVIVAGHSTAGVYGNVVAHNLLTYNGTLRQSPGAGVIVFGGNHYRRVHTQVKFT